MKLILVAILIFSCAACKNDKTNGENERHVVRFDEFEPIVGPPFYHTYLFGVISEKRLLLKGSCILPPHEPCMKDYSLMNIKNK